MHSKPKKIAVLLFNLGGPDKPESVKPFLFNLFNDKNIITVPNPIRFLLAKLISSRREETAKEIYSHLGGKSPIMEETIKQSTSLQQLLNTTENTEQNDYKVFVAMRYWHPFSEEVIQDIIQYAPDELVLLPLYPQLSTTTTGSSFEDWYKKMQQYPQFTPKMRAICCYPTDNLFIESHVQMINEYIATHQPENYRLLFSAHGLPEKIIAKGDPYQYQVEQTVQQVVNKLSIDSLDYTICYQSKVGPLAWITPSTDDEIIRAGNDKKGVVIVPIAFVSEHSETLVELDIEYKELADEHQVPFYGRIATLTDYPSYIQSLARLCKQEKADCFQCPNHYSQCDKQKQRAFNG